MRCMLPDKRTTRHTSGFTLIEMLIVAPIVLLTIAVFIGALIYLTGETLIARTTNSLAYDTQEALNTIEYDVTTSGAFLATNNVAISSPQGYDNATAAFTNASSTNGTMLIINSFATSDEPYWNQRHLITLKDEPYACNHPSVNKNQLMTYNIIYFVKDNALWRRMLLPSNYQTDGCDSTTPWQKPTCAPGVTGGLCQARDTKLLDNVDAAGFNVEYFVSSDDPTPITAASLATDTNAQRQAALSTTNTVLVTLTATRTVAGKTADYTGALRISRIGALTEYSTPVP